MFKSFRRRSDNQDTPCYIAYLEQGKPLLLLHVAEQEATQAAAGVTVARGRRSMIAAGVTAVCVTGSVLLTLPASADQTPSKVLQSVEVQLGADGSIQGISSSQVRKDTLTSKITSDRQQFDPQSVAGDLPLRVTTSYSLTDRGGHVSSGTDLRQVRSKSGTVQISITVQNLTVTPQQLTYDDGSGMTRTQYAMVATPLTVTAAAVLPKASLAKIVLPASDHVGTDGVLGHSGNGDTTVQWAALLAPPQLSSSSTFTLVENGDRFDLPKVDISAQPGMATDTSIDRLSSQALSGGSQLSLEAHTINLIDKVNGILGDAAHTLGGVQTALQDGQQRIGTQLVGELQASGQELGQAATALTSSLNGMKADFSSSLDSNNRQVEKQLATTVTSLLAVLGTPTGEKLTAYPISAGCKVQLGTGNVPATLYAQVFQASRQLLTLGASTTGCGETIKAALRASLGTANGTCSDTSKDAYCLLLATQKQLADVAVLVETSGSALVRQFDPNAVDYVHNTLGTLTQRIVDLQTSAAAIRSGVTVRKVDTSLRSVIADLNRIIGSLSPGKGGLTDSLQTLSDLAAQHSNVTDVSILKQVNALAVAICATPAPQSGKPTPTPTATAKTSPTASPTNSPSSVASTATTAPADLGSYVDRLRTLVSGTDCNDKSLAADGSFPTPLTDRLTDEQKAWLDVAHATDTTSNAPYGAAADLADLRVALDTLKSNSLETEKALGGADATSVSEKLTTLLQQIDVLYNGAAADACPTPAQPASDVQALNALLTTFNALDCNQRGLGQNLSELLVKATPTFERSAAEVGQRAADVVTARQVADDQLGGLLGTLNTALTTEASDSLAKGTERIKFQTNKLETDQKQLSDKFSTQTALAIKTITESVNASNRQLGASTKILSASLGQVEKYLGTGTGRTGLLGVVNLQSAQTGAGKSNVTDAVGQASQFQKVRGSELSDIYLQQSQVAAALRLQLAYPPFQLHLPEGSSSTEIFSFHLGNS